MMTRLSKVFMTCIFVLIAACAFPQGTGNGRFALIIGNGSYKSGSLANAVNDAKDTATVFKQIGFDVTLLTDSDQKQMRKSVDDFGRKIQNAEIALFYFSGHGIQSDGINYLIPLSASLESESDLKYESLDSNDILKIMEDSRCKTNIVILDACRNNPFKATSRSGSRGLAEMRFSSNIESMIVYSTAAGTTASDGKGRNSPFTQSLIKHIAIPDVDIRILFGEVTGDVKKATHGKQIPWTSSSITKPLYFLQSRNSGSTASNSIQILEGSLKITVNTESTLYADEKELLTLPAYSVSTVSTVCGPTNLTVMYSDGYIERREITVKPDTVTELAFSYIPAKERNSLSPECTDMIFIKGGSFNMGSTEKYDYATPVHAVTVSSFYISAYEVTQNEWIYVMGNNPSRFSAKPPKGSLQEKRPVDSISWYDALVYCNRRSLQEGLTPCYSINGSANPDDWGKIPQGNDTKWNNAIMKKDAGGYRLPTEAEWEYACRGGAKSGEFAYSGSNNVDSVAWYTKNAVSGTTAVAKKKENELSLFDMNGNVAEWCWDTISAYSSESQIDPAISSTDSKRVVRGGSWNLSANKCTCCVRSLGRNPYVRNLDMGLRIVRSH